MATNFRGSYWWRDLLKLIEKFKGMAMVTVKDGKSCFFWLDLWNGRVLSQAVPELFSFVKNQHSTVYLVTSSASFHEHFHLPLSPEAFSQFLDLQLFLQHLQLQTAHDTWSYIWGTDNFSTKHVYRHLIGHRSVHPAFQWLWKSCCQNKRKIFFWLILQQR